MQEIAKEISVKIAACTLEKTLKSKVLIKKKLHHLKSREKCLFCKISTLFSILTNYCNSVSSTVLLEDIGFTLRLLSNCSLAHADTANATPQAVANAPEIPPTCAAQPIHENAGAELKLEKFSALHLHYNIKYRCELKADGCCNRFLFTNWNTIPYIGFPTSYLIVSVKAV